MVGLIILGFAILFKVPVEILSNMLESVFHFRRIRDIQGKLIVIDVCNDNFKLSQTIRSRFPFVIALGTCLLVSILVFVEGCIFSSRHVYGTKSCSDRIPNCYLFKSRFSSFEPFTEYVCEPDHPVLPNNGTAEFAVCYGFVLPDQTAIDFLNQLGVCTGILSLIDSIYPLVYRAGRKKWGRACLLFLLLTLIIIEILVLSHEINISFITIILITLAEVLMLTVLYLHYRKSRNTIDLDQVGTYIPLDSIDETRTILNSSTS